MQTHLFGSEKNNSLIGTAKKDVKLLTTYKTIIIKFHIFKESAILVGTLNTETKSSNKFI